MCKEFFDLDQGEPLAVRIAARLISAHQFDSNSRTHSIPAQMEFLVEAGLGRYFWDYRAKLRSACGRSRMGAVPPDRTGSASGRRGGATPPATRPRGGTFP